MPAGRSVVRSEALFRSGSSVFLWRLGRKSSLRHEIGWVDSRSNHADHGVAEMNAPKAPSLLPVAGRSARGRAACLALLVAAVAWSILLSTAPITPLVWDEGDAILRAAAIPRQFEYTTTREGHPAGYGLVIRLGHAVSGAFCSPLLAWRLGPMTLFAAAVGAVCYRMARDRSFAAALGTAAAVFCMPRLFAHAHFASFDGPLTACWLISWVVYATWIGRLQTALSLREANEPVAVPHDAREPASARQKRPRSWLCTRNAGPSRMPAGFIWPIAAGAALGATMSCKATGWLAAAPPMVWSLVCWFRAIQAERRARVNPTGSENSARSTDQAALARRIALGTFGLVLPAALATFMALNPPLWRQPIAGLLEFLRLNLYRGDHAGLNIATQFFGRLYNLDYPLPWYNTIVWTAITVPLGILSLAGVGIVSPWIARRYSPLCDAPPPSSAAGNGNECASSDVGLTVNGYGGLLLAHWSILLIVRALPAPGVPPHDAERLILPSFAFLAVLCGLGTDRLCRWARGRRRSLMQSAIAAVVAVSVFPTYWFAPQGLSYYNPLVGGLPGAVALGLEPTYYWDSFDREVIDWLNTHTAPDERVLLLAAPDDNLALLRAWGVVRFETDRQSPLRLRWVVVQHRPSGWQPDAQRLIATAEPVLTKRLGCSGWGPWRLDVPLLTIYDAADYAVAPSPARPH